MSPVLTEVADALLAVLWECGSTAVSQSEASIRGGGNTSTDPYPRGRHGPIRLGLGALKYNKSNCDAYETAANGNVMYVLNTETPRTNVKIEIKYTKIKGSL